MKVTPTEVEAAIPKKRADKVTLYLDSALHEWFRAYCLQQGIAQSRLMAVLLRRYREEL